MNEKDLKTLIVSWGVYPASRASSIVVSNLASQLSADQFMIAGQKPLKIVKDEWKDTYPKINYVGTGLGWMEKGRRFFRWIQWIKFPFVLYKLLRLHNRNNFKAVVAVFPDEYYLFAAYLLCKWKKILFFPWFHNSYLENRTASRKWFAKWLQPKIFKQACCTFVMSEGLQEFYKKQYPNYNFSVLTHGFDIPELIIPSNLYNKKPIKLVLTGTINQTCIEATKRFCEAIKDNESYELNIYTKVPEHQLIKIGIQGKNIKYKGFLPSLNDLRNKLLEFDIAILTHGFHGGLSKVEYETIFPTRVVPLLYSGIPVIAHTPKNSFLTRFLKKHECAEVVDEKDSDKIKTAINKIAADGEARKKLIQNAYTAAKKFENKLVADHLIKMISKHYSSSIGKEYGE